MSKYFEELDYCPTPLGALTLRRRRDLKLGKDVWEVKLGDAFLMSSHFTASEIALAELGLGALDGRALDVAVGGLGLGYTAEAALKDTRVRSLTVVELFGAVIGWHRDGLVPVGPVLSGDARCRFVEGDFFALASSADGFDPGGAGRTFDAVLLDIDHSPAFFLDEANAAFYSVDGLARLQRHIRPGGVFGLWSNDTPDAAFLALLEEAFACARAETVTFHNPLQDNTVTQTVYLARTAEGAPAA